jgi:ankyrin repeat protein
VFASHRRETLLHAAVSGESIESMKMLLLHGASVNVPNCCSQTPLMVAIIENMEEIVPLLLKHSPDLDYQDNEGMTPLMYAVTSESILHRLIKNGANLAIKDCRGYTVLHHAILEAQTTAIQTLLAHNKSAPSSAVYLLQEKSFKERKFKNGERIDVIFQLFDSFALLSPQCKGHLYLLKATWFLFGMMTSSSATLEQSNFFDHCKHMLYKAVLVDGLTLPFIDAAREEYYGMTFINSVHGLNEMYNQSPDAVQISLVKQCSLIRESILGFEDVTVAMFLLFGGEFLIFMKTPEGYENGLRLLVRGTELLLHRVKKMSEVSFKLLREALRIVRSTRFESVKNSNIPMLIAFGSELCNVYLTPAVSNLIEYTCECVDIKRKSHAHLINEKSFISSIQLLLTTLHTLQQIDPPGFDLKGSIELLIDRCPQVLFDANGSPTTLIHVLLQMQSAEFQTEHMLRLILESSNGHWLVNGVGPLGMRPLHLTHQESIIKLLLDHGANLNAVNSKGKSALKDLEIRRPDLFPQQQNVVSLKNLSALAIVRYNFSYLDLHFIPPGLKKFIFIHDHRAQDIIIKTESTFVYDF